MGQKGDLHYDRCIGETQERGYQEDPPEEELHSLQEQGDLMSSWSAEQTLQEAKRTDLVLFLDWNQSRYLRTYKRHMVGQVRLVLQRILSRFLFFDLTLLLKSLQEMGEKD